MYKLNEDSIKRLSDNASIPMAEGNGDYQQFLQDVKVHTVSIVEGQDIVEPDYVALRTGVDGYASTGDQLGMIADVPAWVQTEADKAVLQENKL